MLVMPSIPDADEVLKESSAACTQSEGSGSMTSSRLRAKDISWRAVAGHVAVDVLVGGWGPFHAGLATLHQFERLVHHRLLHPVSSECLLQDLLLLTKVHHGKDLEEGQGGAHGFITMSSQPARFITECSKQFPGTGGVAHQGTPDTSSQPL